MTPMRSAGTLATVAALVAVLLIAACETPTAVADPSAHAGATMPRVPTSLAATTDALRARITVLRASLAAALDSLPVAGAPYRVAVEGRALMKVADSLALLTYQERVLCEAGR